MLKTLERTREEIAPERVHHPLAFFRGLTLALALSLLFWGGLAALAYGVYVLAARL